ncbi:small ribosomal subunit assembling AARP2 protein, partial [Hepatocystis sp. ex Piliocolobus tephrosceles]
DIESDEDDKYDIESDEDDQHDIESDEDDQHDSENDEDDQHDIENDEDDIKKFYKKYGMNSNIIETNYEYGSDTTVQHSLKKKTKEKKIGKKKNELNNLNVMTLDDDKEKMSKLYTSDHELADIISFDSKINISTFLYDHDYVNRKNNYLYFKCDVLNIIKHEKRQLIKNSFLSENKIKSFILKFLLNIETIPLNRNTNNLYSYMHEDNYFFNKTDTFKWVQDDIYIFNNLTLSLGQITDKILIDHFFDLYINLYSLYFVADREDNDIDQELIGMGKVNATDGDGDGDGSGDNSEDKQYKTEIINSNSIKENFKKLQEQKEIEKEKFMETEQIGTITSNVYGSSVNIGEYIRMTITIKQKQLTLLKNNLIICGGLKSYEEKDSIIHCRIKKHRWFPKILRSNDPLIFSVGWRRYQSIPIYSINERNNVRIRYLKYTTAHMHCNCTFYGPIATVNSGVLALFNYKKIKYFRICINGIILETNTNLSIMKKLKLVGEPYKIFKNTAFIKNMFNSDLEACKFLNCPVITQSGIKGLIKNKLNEKGDFRCSFADKIRMSDIIILKLYINVSIKKYYNYDIENRLRSINELRYIYNVYVNHNSSNNGYRNIPFRHFYHNKIFINPKLLKDLPYKSKPKVFEKHVQNDIKKLKEKKDNKINFNSLSNPTLAAKWYNMLHTIKKNMIDKKKEKSKLVYHKKLKESLRIEEQKKKVVRERKKILYKRGRKS